MILGLPLLDDALESESASLWRLKAKEESGAVEGSATVAAGRGLLVGSASFSPEGTLRDEDEDDADEGSGEGFFLGEPPGSASFNAGGT